MLMFELYNWKSRISIDRFNWSFFYFFCSAHDTEKEEKDDFAGHGAIIDLRPGQNVSDDEDEDEPKKIKKKKKQKKPIEEDSSDTSNKSTRRTRPSSMPGKIFRSDLAGHQLHLQMP